MQLNEQQNRYAQSSAGRKLIRRPMETPGLESTRSNVRNANVSHIYPPGNNSQCNSAYDDEHFQNNNTNPCSSYNSASHATFENSQYPSVSQSRFPQNNILGDPMMANVAVHYGQALVASGRQIVDKELEKYVAVSRLKYYFAVDSAYVGKKLSVILFPFLHTDWSVRYDQNEPIQPKFEINAPDLYIPTMAFLTYILVAGLSLGTKYEFTPEKLSIEATNALLWTTLEVIIALSTLYISNISTNLKTLDLIAYSSYKYVGIIITLLVSLLFGRFGYMLSLFYTVISLAFFLIRTLKLQILTEPMSYQKDVYGIPHSSPFSVQQMGLKRRQYFLLFVSFFQAILMWWLTWRII